MDRRAWQATVHRVIQSWTRLRDLACMHMHAQYMFKTPTKEVFK